MGRKSKLKQLFVYMNSIQIGVLQLRNSSDLSFQYSQSWLIAREARPISLSMPLREQPYAGEQVYHFFDNLLPDNESIRARIQRRFNISSNHCFDLLTAIGQDCVGALQLLSEPLELSDLKIHSKRIDDEEISRLLKNYKNAPLGMDQGAEFRISIAGAQEKTALLFYENNWHYPEKQTPTTHILKLPIGKIEHSNMDLSDSVENEWVCLQILSAFNLPVCEADIRQFENEKVLVCKRFDRVFSQDASILYRIPQEDMCQVFGLSPAIKYESDGGPGIPEIMRFLSGSYDAQTDRAMFFKACFIYWLMGAIDGHAKNFSIHIQAGGRFKLTPFYDVISAYPLIKNNQLQKQKIKMAMSVRAKNKHYHWDKIQLRHWVDTGKLCNLPKSEVVGMIEEVFESLETTQESVLTKINCPNIEQITQQIYSEMIQVKNKKNTNLRD